MNAETLGMFESFRTLGAEKLGAVILERCREEKTVGGKRPAGEKHRNHGAVQAYNAEKAAR